jgi:hypothetical protein
MIGYLIFTILLLGRRKNIGKMREGDKKKIKRKEERENKGGGERK